ncbi:hypothetical protein FRC12_022489 [Ceratobasidium sp. 428]|nr:hypothetical protein FRC12_022489 [Ceratobasidium sp. 428]
MQLINGTHVFHNSTLLSTICGYSETKDILCIMRTSRSAFSIAASRIWRSLDGVEPLLMLLTPALEFVDEEGGLLVKLPGQRFIPETDFTRFKSYNTLVRELTVSRKWKLGGIQANTFRLQYWSGLFPDAQCVPLLPSLYSLTISRDFPDDTDEVVFWLSALISPSLNILNIYPTLAFHNTATALGLLTQKAPQLQRLEHRFNIAPGRYDHEFIEQFVASQLVLSPLACSHIHNSQKLVYLKVRGHFITGETLVALSRLPKLRQLAIDNFQHPNDGELARTLREARLPPESFPAIRQLQLDSSLLDDFVALWSIVPLVSGLKTITLKTLVIEQSGIKHIFSKDVLAILLPSISKSSPRTKSLTLGGIVLLDHLKPVVLGRNKSPWAHVSQLPLSRLRLEDFRADSEWLKNARFVWPQLQILELPSQLLAFQHLIYISQLPKLKALSAAGFEGLLSEVPKIQASDKTAPLRIIDLAEMLKTRVEINFVEAFAR